MGVRKPMDTLSGQGVRAAVRAALKGGVSAVAFSSTIVAVSAYGADAREGNIEEVVVTGIRQSLESAQEIKREAEQIVDSVTAQDIGALPDRSVSEALQRIPGITLQRTNENRDPARLASEGGGVFIRGLSWVRSELNGRDIFSANNGRALSFEDVSSDLLSSINVYKNPSADMIEGGIGGSVDLRTRTPFDTEDELLAVSLDYNYADLLDDGFTSGNALFSNQWETDAGRFGALVSYSIGNIGNRTDSIQTGRYEALMDGSGNPFIVNGQGVYVPNSVGWRRIDWEQERTAANVALQFAPNDSLVFTLNALQAEADPKDIEYAIGDYTPNDYDLSTVRFDQRNVLIGGSLLSSSLDANTRSTDRHNETRDISLNMQWDINDRWSFGADVQVVESESSVVSMTAYTEHGDQGGTLDFDLSGDTPFMRWNEDTMADPRAYWWAAAMDHIEDNEADEVAARMDLEYEFDDNPWLKSLRFGARATEKEATTRQTGYNWAFLSQQFWGGDGTPVRLGDNGFPDQISNNGTPDDPSDDFVRLPGRTNPALGDLGYVAQLVNFNDFFRGDVRRPGVAWFPSRALVANGTQNAFAVLRDTQSAGWGWTPLTEESYGTARPAGDNVVGGINDQGEKTLAGYVMVRFGMDESPIGRFDGNIGARVVRTETDAKGLSMSMAALQGGTPEQCAAAAAIDPNLDCGPYNQAYAFAQGGTTVPPVDASNSYTDVLPTLNLRYFVTDDLQVRFAAGKAISRPNFSQMVPYSTIGFNFTNFYPNAGGWATGSGGNPQLKPTKSTQFDTSIEWYFSPSGSLTAALFYKDIKDYIFIGNDEETYTSANGESVTFLVSRNMNGAKGRIRGFEIGYQQFYDMLPGALSGLGFQANFTYVDSSGGKNTAVNILEPAQVQGAEDQELPLEGLSETSYNVALMYEKYGISARLAYNWREEYLLTTSAANIQRPVWMEDYGQLDGSVFYSITDSVKVGIQATNLLNSRTFLDVGGVSLHPRYSWTDTDRRIAFAVRSTF